MHTHHVRLFLYKDNQLHLHLHRSHANSSKSNKPATVKLIPIL